MSSVISPAVSPPQRLSDTVQRDCHLVVEVVAQSTGIERAAFFAPSRLRRAASHARQVAMYLCHVLLELNLTQVGLFFGRDRTTVAHACGRIEDLRDDVTTDAHLQALEDKVLIIRNRDTGLAPELYVPGGMQHAAL